MQDEQTKDTTPEKNDTMVKTEKEAPNNNNTTDTDTEMTESNQGENKKTTFHSTENQQQQQQQQQLDKENEVQKEKQIEQRKDGKEDVLFKQLKEGLLKPPLDVKVEEAPNQGPLSSSTTTTAPSPTETSTAQQQQVKLTTSSPAPTVLVSNSATDTVHNNTNNNPTNSSKISASTSTTGYRASPATVTIKQQPNVPELPPNVKPSQVIGGAPLRQWINNEITPFLLEGMRLVSKERPAEPLKFLGEYLLKEHEKKQQQQEQQEQNLEVEDEMKVVKEEGRG